MGSCQLNAVHSSAQAAVRGSDNDIECITSFISSLFLWLPAPLAAQTWHDAAALLCSLLSDRSLCRFCCYCAAQGLQSQMLHKLLRMTHCLALIIPIVQQSVEPRQSV